MTSNRVYCIILVLIGSLILLPAERCYSEDAAERAVRPEEGRRIRVLLTNDDGILSPGLTSLFDELIKAADVTVVAPAENRSGSSGSITIHDPLVLREVKRNGRFFGLSVSGTPVDAVRIALMELMGEPPDVIASGINRGENLGHVVLNSGTVGAALEGAVRGVPSIAFSMAKGPEMDYSNPARFARELIVRVAKRGLPQGVALNVNFPNLPGGEITGVALTRLGSPLREVRYERRVHPWGFTYFWFALTPMRETFEPGTDGEAVSRGAISITPIGWDLTRRDLMEELADLAVGK